LTKAFAESIEEMDDGAIEALKASGASFWQIIFQAVVPSSISHMTAWTFLRLEINFTNAIAIGAAAGAGGIGFDLYMAGNHYFDLRELGFITYIVVAAVILLEIAATKIKAKIR
jgi:phosphonate transport system permease protein